MMPTRREETRSETPSATPLRQETAQGVVARVGHAHIVGLGGIGTSAIAQWLQRMGWTVTGVDRAGSSITEALARVGIAVEQENVEQCPSGTSLLVYSGAVPSEHPLRTTARAAGIREISYAELLGALTRPYRTIGVSGSHGKSTTTALVGLLLEAASKDPTVVIGTRVPQWEQYGVGNYRPGHSDVAVVEADEYGKHFLELVPEVALVTSLDHDHVDEFPTSVDYQAAFEQFVQRVSPGGTIVLCAEDPATLALRSALSPRQHVLTYGVGNIAAHADVHATEPQSADGVQTFRVTVRGQDWGVFTLRIPGRHVVLDAVGALAATLTFGVSPDTARRAFEAFQGTWRRFERVGQLNGAPVISDYAHHPTEVRALAAAARQGFPDRRLIIAFQPHHHARTIAFQPQFIDALRGFDAVVLAEVYDVAGREHAQRTSTRAWADTLRAEGKDATYAAAFPELEAHLRNAVGPNDALFVVGAGDIDTVARRIAGPADSASALRSAHPVVGTLRIPSVDSELRLESSLSSANGGGTVPARTLDAPPGMGPSRRTGTQRVVIEERISLARYSTLHVGGEARYFTRVTTLPELREALTWATEQGVPWFILGGGSNFFCRQEGFPGLVIKMENRDIAIDDNELTVDAGAITRLAVTHGVRQGLRGMERLAGIPGTIGGAVRGNAGAFGMETKDRLARVHVLRRSAAGWEEDMLPREDLTFEYRGSTFKRDPTFAVVWRATFALERGDVAEGERLVNEDLMARRAKQPYEFPSVGSVFRNPSSERPAGALIEAAGLKGHRVGSAEVSTKHANFIVNRGGATAADVSALVAEIQRRVFETSGVSLTPEIFPL
ncbi:MAG: UDP-N-acetylmuramate--alanine ligase [Parcubacteria group bacterium Gr01-1014_106]|nr:MAG: UDP-N-acetylmuramate--alanine ligase [Parcubacteria group bacterium Gr01-1014_106]